MRVFKAPHNLDKIPAQAPWLFLAGSIDMGAAENWQERLTQALSDTELVLLNPRRDDWDSSWKQEKQNTQFFEQVTWEQDALDASDAVVVYFSKDSKAPITFLELGQRIGEHLSNTLTMNLVPQKLFVFCPEGFYRKGNVDIVCERANIPVYTDEEAMLKDIRQWAKS